MLHSRFVGRGQKSKARREEQGEEHDQARHEAFLRSRMPHNPFLARQVEQIGLAEASVRTNHSVLHVGLVEPRVVMEPKRRKANWQRNNVVTALLLGVSLGPPH